MKYILFINCRGKLHKRLPGGVRRSLPYQGIARRKLTVDKMQISFYDKDIDVSAMLL